MFDLRRILSIFFPARCPFCNEVITYDEVVCETCAKKIHYKNFKDTVVTRDGKTFMSVSPFSYTEPIRTAIHDYKFHGVKRYAVPFGKYVTDVLKENYDISKVDYITSVPLHKTRKRERGFNQAETFAREVSRLTEIKYIELLKKAKKNKIQHELNLAERAENVKDVYAVIDSDTVKGKIIVICDDILTSGNTMAECAKMLMDAGAKEVIGAKIANVESKMHGTVRINK